jgi:ATP-binding cassette, sub-family E, member 1
LKPNLGLYKQEQEPSWQDILKYFRGSDLQNYFKKVLEDNLKAVTKPQFVDAIPKAIKDDDKSVQAIMNKLSQQDNLDEILDTLELRPVLDRDVNVLSGGELQRFALGAMCVQKADVYLVDEPGSYLDVKQRLIAARTIRALLKPTNYVVCIEHDLAMLDYLSDFICCLYGRPAVYGVVTMPYSVREGINIFLDGHIPSENLRFREESLTFRIAEAGDEFRADKARSYSYPKMKKTLGNFELYIQAGEFSDSEIIVMMGENGTGKTTFCKVLAGILKPDDDTKIPKMAISMKPQKLTAKFTGMMKLLKTIAGLKPISCTRY